MSDISEPAPTVAAVTGAGSPAKPTTPIADVAQPGKSAPSDNSRSSVINHSRVKDPMMVTAPTSDSAADSDSDTEAAEAADRSRFKASSKRITIQPLNAPVPASNVQPEPASTAQPDNKSASASSTVKTPGATDAVSVTGSDSQSARYKPQTATTNPSSPSSDSDKKAAKLPGQSNEEAEAAARAEHQASIQKLIDSKQYFLPIATVEQQRKTHVMIFGIVLVVILGLAWVDIALDAGIIHAGGIKPLTHFFSG